MSHTEAPISINLKSASGLTQLTLRANTPDEFTALTSAIFQITEAIGEVETAVRGSNAAVPPQPATATVAGLTSTDIQTTRAPAKILSEFLYSRNRMAAPVSPDRRRRV